MTDPSRVVGLILGLTLAGCVGTLEPVDPGGGGGDDTGGGGDSVARQMFDTEVQPLLQGACASCHVGPAGTTPLRFLGTGAIPEYYTSLVAQPVVIGNWDPAAATLLTKGVHDANRARAWTQAEQDTISMWLLAEAGER